MLETLEGLQLIRAFGRESHEQHRFELASRQVRKAFFKLERVSALVHPLSEVLTVSLLLAILLVVAIRTPGQMAVSLTFLVLLYRLQPRVKQLDFDRVALDALSASLRKSGAFSMRATNPICAAAGGYLPRSRKGSPSKMSPFITMPEKVRHSSR